MNLRPRRRTDSSSILLCWLALLFPAAGKAAEPLRIVDVEPTTVASGDDLEIHLAAAADVQLASATLVFGYEPETVTTRAAVSPVGDLEETKHWTLRAQVPQGLGEGPIGLMVVGNGALNSQQVELTIEDPNPAWLYQALGIALVLLLALTATAWIRLRKIWAERIAKQVERGMEAASASAGVAPRRDARLPPEAMTGPVRLRSLKFANLRSFADLSLSFETAPEPAAEAGKGEGQWVLLLGDNGVGKSTILRGLALALVDPDTATALLQTQEVAAPYVRIGQDHAEITVRLAGKSSYEVEIDAGGLERLRIKRASRQRPVVFAYGPQRGTAVGRADRSVSFSPALEVSTLFKEGSELIHAETWLKDLQLGALESVGGPEEVFFEAVRDSLLGLLPGVDHLDVSSRNGVRLSGEAVGEDVPLAALSDGYVSTMGWILDLLARWSERRRRIAGTLPGKTMATEATGLVLVDEIGLHLHPVWQMDVVHKVRQMFPSMSFVATSHHPLTLLGARPGEVYVLHREPESGAVEIRQSDVPPGTTADEILTGQWFNLPSTLDPDTRALLEEHREMLRESVAEDDHERRELEREIRERLGSFPGTSLDKMAQSALVKVLSEQEDEEITPERREEVREEMLEELRNSETL